MSNTVIITVVAVLLSVVVQIIWMVYEARFYRRAGRDAQGRIAIKLGAMSWVFSLISVAMCISIAGMTVQSVIANDEPMFWLLVGTPLAVLMGFATYVTSWTRLRVSPDFVEYRGLKGWTRFSWEDVKGVYHNSILGHLLKFNGRQPAPVWIYGHGKLEVGQLFLVNEKSFEV